MVRDSEQDIPPGLYNWIHDNIQEANQDKKALSTIPIARTFIFANTLNSALIYFSI